MSKRQDAVGFENGRQQMTSAQNLRYGYQADLTIGQATTDYGAYAAPNNHTAALASLADALSVASNRPTPAILDGSAPHP